MNVSSAEFPPVNALRIRKIPVECISIHQAGGLKIENSGKGLGNNYRVSGKDLDLPLAGVIRQGRLQTEVGIDPPFKILPSAVEVSLLTGDSHRHLASALAPPIWFRETIPYARAYRA